MLAQLLVFHRKRLNLLNELQMASSDPLMVPQLNPKSRLALNTTKLILNIKHLFPGLRTTRSLASHLRSNTRQAQFPRLTLDHNSQPRCPLP